MHPLIEKFPRFVEYCTAPYTADENRKMTIVENTENNRLEYKLPLKEGTKTLGFLICGIMIQEELVIYAVATSKGKTTDAIGQSTAILDMLEPPLLDYSSIFDRIIAKLFKTDDFKNLRMS